MSWLLSAPAIASTRPPARPDTVAFPPVPVAVITSPPFEPLTRMLVGRPVGGKVGADGTQIGGGEVVDVEPVGAAEGGDVDLIDVVEVHDDAADVAREPHAPAAGGDVELLVGAGAVERHRVLAGLALDRVAAVARVPDEAVIVRAQ